MIHVGAFAVVGTQEVRLCRASACAINTTLSQWLGSEERLRETLPPSIRFPTCVLFTNRRSCKPWFGLVYSEDNLSNLLSREKFELLKQLRSTGRVLDRPTMATFGCDKVDVPGLTMGLA